MKEIIIKTQAQLNKIKHDFEGIIYLEGGTQEDPLILERNFEKAEVIVRGDCQLIMRENSTVQRMWGNSTVQDMRGNSTVRDMRENSTVQRMWGNSTVQDMWENSTVRRMWENSTVQRMWGNSTVQDMWGNSTVRDMWENSTVQRMWGNSTVQNLYGEAMVSAYGMNKIVCHGYNIVRTRSDNKKNLILVMNKDSHLIVIPTFEPTFDEFKKRFPFEVKNSFAILYKAVHKIDGNYFSDYDRKMEYIIGATYEHKVAPKEAGSCATGLHVAIKDWAIFFGKEWDDYALLECEVPIKDIIVCSDCDGKVRTSKLKVLREVIKNDL